MTEGSTGDGTSEQPVEQPADADAAVEEHQEEHEAAHEPPAEPDAEPDADTLRRAAEAIDDARRRVAEVPAEVVVTNHVMGLYELAAIHLSVPAPDLRAAALAIDAVACLVDGLGDRIGPDAPTMRDALSNIRLAFVQVKAHHGEDGG